MYKHQPHVKVSFPTFIFPSFSFIFSAKNARKHDHSAIDFTSSYLGTSKDYYEPKKGHRSTKDLSDMLVPDYEGGAILSHSQKYGKNISKHNRRKDTIGTSVINNKKDYITKGIYYEDIPMTYPDDEKDVYDFYHTALGNEYYGKVPKEQKTKLTDGTYVLDYKPHHDVINDVITDHHNNNDLGHDVIIEPYNEIVDQDAIIEPHNEVIIEPHHDVIQDNGHDVIEYKPKKRKRKRRRKRRKRKQKKTHVNDVTYEYQPVHDHNSYIDDKKHHIEDKSYHGEVVYVDDHDEKHYT